MIINQMQYAVVFFPSIQSQELDDFRGKFDPKSTLIPPHITLVFPVSGEIGQDSLIKHIQESIASIKPFGITLEGTHLASDNYLYLLVSKGNEKIVELHDRLYTGVLAPYLRTDLEFIPHLTIGYFEKNNSLDKNQYDLAKEALQNSPFNFEVSFDSISLIQINDPALERKVVRSFAL